MFHPKIVTRDEWLAARTEFLVKEKEFTRQRYALAEARRELPMVKVDKEYIFDGPNGRAALGDLFDGRRQLIVYHFMFHPDWNAGCKHCSCVMDNLAGGLVHLTARDTSFVAVSRAPLAKLESFKKRMGWEFPWVSSYGSDFNQDYHVTLDPDQGHSYYNYRTVGIRGEMPGLSVFFNDDGQILHSYSTYFVGLDIFLPMYHLLDVTPLGRQEDDTNSMTAGDSSWIRFHDEYNAETAPTKS
ncbi:DUF899 domain-containing protein [Amycolatopsis sp. K13G38]|uniref:DUF899 domain-containing protein n=1 Tax=Amycolatopsis acididurans TaxID=2724524 RepID=A0ABX1JIF9_9PSEU|nr:DUF899 domain-containing protein [Amycolatopsis acididurans]NKQ58625.1 DUF899 domain-containing protein [Amycolatopsis acididurans]